MLCCVVLCYVMLCYVMLCYVMLCYVKKLGSEHASSEGRGGSGETWYEDILPQLNQNKYCIQN